MNEKKKLILQVIGASTILILIFVAGFLSFLYDVPETSANFLLENNIELGYEREDFMRDGGNIFGYYVEYYGDDYDGQIGMPEEENIIINEEVTLLIKAGDMIKKGVAVARSNLSNELFYADEYDGYRVGYIEHTAYGELINIYNPQTIVVNFEMPVKEYKALAEDGLEIKILFSYETINFTDYTYKLASNGRSYLFELSGIEGTFDRGLLVNVRAIRLIVHKYARIRKDYIVSIKNDIAYVHVMINDRSGNTTGTTLTPVKILREDNLYYYVENDDIDFRNQGIMGPF
ncbi:MAG: hypothetical protein LBF12_07410 [Christensenellaceae bacterium]|jgi:hypothetical protein|nr:hypothetical protein [Christensenellaceae bacterium]